MIDHYWCDISGWVNSHCCTGGDHHDNMRVSQGPASAYHLCRSTVTELYHSALKQTVLLHIACCLPAAQLPQLLKILWRRSAEGLSLTSMLLQLYAFSCPVVYAMANNYPLLYVSRKVKFLLFQHSREKCRNMLNSKQPGVLKSQEFVWVMLETKQMSLTFRLKNIFSIYVPW